MYGDAGLRNTSVGIALLHDAPAIEHDRDVAEQTPASVKSCVTCSTVKPTLEVDRAQMAARARRASADRAR